MDRSSPVCIKNHLNILWNNFRITVLRLWLSHRLRPIKLSNDFGNLGNSLCRRGWKSILDAHDLQALRQYFQHCIKKTGTILSWESVCELRTTFRKHTYAPDMPPSSLGQSSLKMDRGKVENSSVVERIDLWNSFEFLFGKHRHS